MYEEILIHSNEISPLFPFHFPCPFPPVSRPFLPLFSARFLAFSPPSLRLVIPDPIGHSSPVSTCRSGFGTQPRITRLAACNSGSCPADETASRCFILPCMVIKRISMC